MLPSSANVEAVYLGAGGIIESAKAGQLCVDMSTIDPGTSQRVAPRLEERGLRGVLAWAWPRGFLVGLQVPEAVERRRSGLML